MPPRIATANALMPNNVPISELTLNSGAINSPARPASAVEIMNDTATVRATEQDPNPANNSATASTLVVLSLL